MADFKDNFSQQAEIYAKYRPTYPAGLFQFIYPLAKNHDLAIDCGTGNGQAALALTESFEKVLAFDASSEQIKHALSHPKIKYFVSSSHNIPAPDNSADLVTVATALHWFNLDKFYPEVKRVLKRGGIIAIWGYTVQKVEPFLDDLLIDFQFKTLKNYWASENKIVEDEYRNIHFPFDEIDTPVFYAEKHFDLDDLIGYLNTWSAVQKFIQKNNYSPTKALRNELLDYWKNPRTKKRVEWRLALRVGRYI